MVCTPDPVLAGLVSLCLMTVVDMDGDEVTWETELLAGSGVCLELDGNCTTTISGTSNGGQSVPIPIAIVTSPFQDTTATIRATVRDEHGEDGLPVQRDVDVIVQNPPTIDSFACLPAVVIGGLSSLCALVAVDLDDDPLEWRIEVTGNTNACLVTNNGCVGSVGGTANGLLELETIELRTFGNTSGFVSLRATVDDGNTSSQKDFTVQVL
jgi:hypothetical protein